MLISTFLLISAAATTAIVGTVKTGKAIKKNHEAKKTNENANSIINRASSNLDKARKKCQKNLTKLGEAKITILNSTLKDFILSFSKLKNVNLSDSKGLNEAAKLRIDSKEFEELKELGSFAASLATGLTSGALGGAITAFGAYSAAGMLATASTGTAISALSGAAATNATLAFFGGGSLAAGGLGIAGGTAVLGGLVAGPALAVMGFIVDAKSTKALEEAKENYAQACKTSKELNLAEKLCDQIAMKCSEFQKLLEQLDEYLVPLLSQMEAAIVKHNGDFNKFSEKEKNATALAVSLVKAIKEVLDTPILTSKGDLTKESKLLSKKIVPEKIVSGK